VSASPFVASHFSGGATKSDQAWVLFQQEDLTKTPPVSIIMVARYDTVTGGPVQTIANGCGGGGTFSIDGAFAFGENPTYRLSGADNNSPIAVFFAGFLGARQQIPCGTCTYLLGPIAIGLPISGGAAQLRWSIPCDLRLLDFDLDAQMIVLRTTTSPCAVLPGLSASNVLRARVRD